MFKKIKMMVALLVAGSMLFCASCTYFSLGTEKYEDYRIYDHNLTYKKVDRVATAVHMEHENDSLLSGTTEIYYRRIKGVGSKDFIVQYTNKTEFLAESNPSLHVMQNPENYISVIDNWTIDKMQLSYFSINDPNYEEFPLKNLNYILGDLDDHTEEFYKLRAAKEGRQYLHFKGHHSWLAQNDLYLRLTFEEEENILWEAPLYFGTYEKERQLFIKMTYPPASAQESGAQPLYIPLPEDSALYQQIYDYIDTLAEK